MSWILNSITKDLSEGFMYARNSKELWEEIQTRFGECNGPLEFQIQREISSIKQDNKSVAFYFTQLKKLWDQFGELAPIPSYFYHKYTCDVYRRLPGMSNRNKIMQFLMGLNDSFETVRSNLLMMKPIHSTNKAYALVLKDEKQKFIFKSASRLTEDATMMVKTD
eukprot:XP_015574195.1 uncharacterized protein LOC107261201 [Ricinus communis]